MAEADSNAVATEFRPRSLRYALECPLHFREGSEATWHEGTLKNISATGLFFEPDEPWPAFPTEPPDRSLEITFTFPPPGIGCLSCRANVVRYEARAPGVAARITDYALGRLDDRRFVPPETQDVLWTLTRDGSYADAIVVRTEEEGAELQYRMDDNCYYTHRYNDGEEQEMIEDALAMRRLLEARGWATGIAG